MIFESYSIKNMYLGKRNKFHMDIYFVLCLLNVFVFSIYRVLVSTHIIYSAWTPWNHMDSFTDIWLRW